MTKTEAERLLELDRRFGYDTDPTPLPDALRMLTQAMDALRHQWEENHDEQCSNVAREGDGHTCRWPKPEVLREWES